jgi:hypothetical protein
MVLRLSFNDHVILSNHSSERLYFFKNAESNFALHAYNMANDYDVILSNQLRICLQRHELFKSTSAVNFRSTTSRSTSI